MQVRSNSSLVLFCSATVGDTGKKNAPKRVHSSISTYRQP